MKTLIVFITALLFSATAYAAGLTIDKSATNTDLSAVTGSITIDGSAIGGGGGEDAFTAESSPGTTPTATGTDAVGIGDGAVAGNATADLGALAIGARSTSTGINSIAIGENTTATGDNCIAIGGHTTGSTASRCIASNSIAIGKDSNAVSSSDISIGLTNTANGGESISIGAHASATGSSSIGIGHGANSDGGSSLALGRLATSSGVYSVAIGRFTDATGANSIAIGGHSTDADSADALAANAIAIGVNTLASGVDSVAIGNRATATDVGEFAYASGYFAAVGDAQTSMYVLRNQTTNATQTELFTNGSSTGISVATDSTVFYRISIAARRTDADNESAAYVIEGCIDNNAGTTALVGGLGTKTVVAEDTVAWDVTVTADNTNNEINILVTGEASKTIRWVATVVITTVSG